MKQLGSTIQDSFDNPACQANLPQFKTHDEFHSNFFKSLQAAERQIGMTSVLFAQKSSHARALLFELCGKYIPHNRIIGGGGSFNRSLSRAASILSFSMSPKKPQETDSMSIQSGLSMRSTMSARSNSMSMFLGKSFRNLRSEKRSGHIPVTSVNFTPLLQDPSFPSLSVKQTSKDLPPSNFQIDKSIMNVRNSSQSRFPGLPRQNSFTQNEDIKCKVDVYFILFLIIGEDRLNPIQSFLVGTTKKSSKLSNFFKS